jgi:hypothetical protein
MASNRGNVSGIRQNLGKNRREYLAKENVVTKYGSVRRRTITG